MLPVLVLATILLTFVSPLFCSAEVEIRPVAQAEQSRAEEIAQGSQTAKGGFQNEDAIRDKFNNWKNDADAKAWLAAMHYLMADVTDVTASKPHGKKSDIEVRVKTKGGESTEGISIKLVSNPRGFNQIDKRWLKDYAQRWNMTSGVHNALKLFVGETLPTRPGRDERRMFLDEFDQKTQQAVADFFETNREEIVSDLLAGDNEHAAEWLLVTLKPESGASKSGAGTASRPGNDDSSYTRSKSGGEAKWILRSMPDVIRFFGDGEVRITPRGSLQIGRITMQRKGGDNGRPSAMMLQFKMNPAELFEIDAKESLQQKFSK